MPDLLVAALTYAAEGIPVFPCTPLTKVPATAHGFHDATTDPDIIADWWRTNPDYNIAFSPHTVGQGIVDLDGQDGIDAWCSWARDMGGVDRTWTVRTPRGGLHLYFVGELPTSVRKLIPHRPVDTRGRGSYALLPPSATQDGTYRTLYEGAVPVALPVFLIDRVRAMAVRHTVAGSVELDTPTALSRAGTYLAGREPAVEGQGGNQWTYETFCDLRTIGLSEDAAFSLADMVWNGRCQPPWDEYELRQIAENAYRYATDPEPGSKAVDPASGLLDRVAAPEPPKPAAGPVPFGDLLAREVLPVREIIPGLVERGIVTFLAGAGGSHKSRTALHWGLAIASGTPIAGRQVEQCPFLYLSYEDHPDEVTRRTQAICRRLAIEQPGLAQFWDLTDNGQPLARITEEGISEQPFCGQVRGHLKAIPGHKFVVLDSAYNVLQFIGAAKIDEAAVKAGIEFLGRLARECDATILILWHPSQAGQERGDASGWSVAWHNTPRARLSLTADKNEEGTYILAVQKRNNAPKGEPLRLRWDSGILSPVEPMARQESDSRVVEAILEIVAEGARTGQFLKKTGMMLNWMRDMVQAAAPSRTVTPDIIRELAYNLERMGKLRYVDGRNSRDLAGYRIVTEMPTDE